MMRKLQTVGVASPLSFYIKGYREDLEVQGYAPDSVHWRTCQFAVLARWMLDQGVTVGHLDDACVARLVAERQSKGRKTMVSVANFSIPIAYLRRIGVVRPEARPSDQVSQILAKYRIYLVTERGLAESSIPVNMLVAENFCNQRTLLLEKLSSAEITTYIADLCARSSIGWSKKSVTALASFLRFLHVEGITTTPLAAALPKLTGHRATVPCEFTESEFILLREGCSNRSDVGLRDRAILTLLWRLGLRRSEVAALRIDDINWRRGEIAIRGKGNRHALLPIPLDVGETLVNYLHDAHRRIPPGCRALFVLVRAPEGAMTSAGVGDVVTRAALRVGLPPMGAHLLRHGTATQLARSGASWPQIAQVMRHRSLAVTASYTTIDPALIRELARPWPGA